jgi:hypothetical protein
MTQARTIPTESQLKSCTCLWPHCPWSNREAELGLSAAGNVGLVLAGSLAALLIWSASSHGALPYGLVDLGLLCLVGIFVVGALVATPRARKARAEAGRASTATAHARAPGFAIDYRANTVFLTVLHDLSEH